MKKLYFSFNLERDVIELNEYADGRIEVVDNNYFVNSLEEFAEIFAQARMVPTEALKNWELIRTGDQVQYVQRSATAGSDARSEAILKLLEQGYDLEEIKAVLGTVEQTSEQTSPTESTAHKIEKLKECIVDYLDEQPEYKLTLLRSMANLFIDTPKETFEEDLAELLAKKLVDEDVFECERCDDYDDYDDFYDEDETECPLTARIAEAVDELLDIIEEETTIKKEVLLLVYRRALGEQTDEHGEEIKKKLLVAQTSGRNRLLAYIATFEPRTNRVRVSVSSITLEEFSDYAITHNTYLEDGHIVLIGKGSLDER